MQLLRQDYVSAHPLYQPSDLESILDGGYTDTIEKVQRRATKLVPELRDLDYMYNRLVALVFYIAIDAKECIGVGAAPAGHMA